MTSHWPRSQRHWFIPARAEETARRQAGCFVVTLFLNERAIRGHIVESLEDRLQRDLILPSKFFGSPRIRTMDDLVDDRRSDSSTLEK